MTNPVLAPLSSVACDGPNGLLPSPGEAWFRTRDGRRFGWEIGVIFVVKLALLIVLWFVFFEPSSGPDTAPPITVQQLYLPSGPSVRHD